jgi:hypothetical protein
MRALARTSDGRDRAKARGVRFGRPPGAGRQSWDGALLRRGPRVSDSVRLGVERQLLRPPVQQLADPEHVLGRARDLVDPAELLQLFAALAEHTQHSAVER